MSAEAEKGRELSPNTITFNVNGPPVKAVLRYDPERNQWEVPEGVGVTEAAQAVFNALNALWRGEYTVEEP